MVLCHPISKQGIIGVFVCRMVDMAVAAVVAKATALLRVCRLCLLSGPGTQS